MYTLNVRIKCCGGCLDIRKPSIKRMEEVIADMMRYEYWPCLHSARHAEHVSVTNAQSFVKEISTQLHLLIFCVTTG